LFHLLRDTPGLKVRVHYLARVEVSLDEHEKLVAVVAVAKSSSKAPLKGSFELVFTCRLW
jgi:hypothetical protein